MANEITANCSLAYSDSELTEDSLALVNFLKTVATKKIVHIKQAVPTAEAALNLGGISGPGYILIKNLDETNFVEIRTATGATKFARLDPGGFAFFRFGSGVTAPFVIADTDACQVEFLLISI